MFNFSWFSVPILTIFYFFDQEGHSAQKLSKKVWHIGTYRKSFSFLVQWVSEILISKVIQLKRGVTLCIVWKPNLLFKHSKTFKYIMWIKDCFIQPKVHLLTSLSYHCLMEAIRKNRHNMDFFPEGTGQKHFASFAALFSKIFLKPFLQYFKVLEAKHPIGRFLLALAET